MLELRIGLERDRDRARTEEKVKRRALPALSRTRLDALPHRTAAIAGAILALPPQSTTGYTS